MSKYALLALPGGMFLLLIYLVVKRRHTEPDTMSPAWQRDQLRGDRS